MEQPISLKLCLIGLYLAAMLFVAAGCFMSYMWYFRGSDLFFVSDRGLDFPSLSIAFSFFLGCLLLILRHKAADRYVREAGFLLAVGVLIGTAAKLSVFLIPDLLLQLGAPLSLLGVVFLSAGLLRIARSLEARIRQTR